MSKISIKIDISKIDKTKITERKYTNKEGVEVVIKELSLDIVPLKEKKVIKEGDTWRMVKTHFVAEPQTKEERANGQPSNILGDGIVFEDNKASAPIDYPEVTNTMTDEDFDLPF
jgi:hypothetical protein